MSDDYVEQNYQPRFLTPSGLAQVVVSIVIHVFQGRSWVQQSTKAMISLRPPTHSLLWDYPVGGAVGGVLSAPGRLSSVHITVVAAGSNYATMCWL